jgi:hypothetical protein
MGARRRCSSGTPGGADRDRTDDLRLAKPALSQLSYSPSEGRRVVGLGRLELPTSRLSGGRSNRAELQAHPNRSDPVRSSDRAPALGPRKTNVVRRRLRVIGRSCPDRTSHRENPGFTASRRSGSAGRPDRTRPGNRRLDEPPKLPRKEVIQPQVPLRLPCYDFTPITSQTLDGSLPCGLGRRLLVQPAFVV